RAFLPDIQRPSFAAGFPVQLLVCPYHQPTTERHGSYLSHKQCSKSCKCCFLILHRTEHFHGRQGGYKSHPEGIVRHCVDDPTHSPPDGECAPNSLLHLTAISGCSGCADQNLFFHCPLAF